MPLNIDWQQILLHLLNFVILAGGLYFLLYKPVEDFMGKREAYYADRQKEADRRDEQTQALKAEYEQKLDKADEEILARKKEAAGELEKVIRARTAEAEEQAKKIIEQAEKTARSRSQKALEDSNRDIRKLAIDAVEKLAVTSDSEALDKFLDEAESEVRHG